MGIHGWVIGSCTTKEEAAWDFWGFVLWFGWSVCVGLSAFVWLPVGLVWGGPDRWAMWGLWLHCWLGVLLRFTGVLSRFNIKLERIPSLERAKT